MSELLYQILLGVLIVAVVILIFVLVRLYLILTDLNQASKVISEEVVRVGSLIDSIVSSLEGLRQTFAGFFASIKGIGKVKEKMADFWKDDESSDETKADEKPETK